MQSSILSCNFCPEFSPATGWGIVTNPETGEDEAHTICLLCAQAKGIADKITPLGEQDEQGVQP